VLTLKKYSDQRKKEVIVGKEQQRVSVFVGRQGHILKNSGVFAWMFFNEGSFQENLQ